MLRLTTKLTIRSRIAIKCEKHRLYNPEKDGQGGIKGNCARCSFLYTVYNTRQAILNAARDYENLTKMDELVKPRVRKPSTETSPELNKAFATLLPKEKKPISGSDKSHYRDGDYGLLADFINGGSGEKPRPKPEDKQKLDLKAVFDVIDRVKL